MIRKVLNIPVYYDNIDSMPIRNWFKIHESNDYSWCISSGSKTFAPKSKLLVVWDNLYCQYIDEFGISDEFKAILKLKAKISLLKFDEQYKKNGGLKTLIKVAELELQNKLSVQIKSSMNDVKTYLIKFLNGMPINENTMSVKEFYGHLRVYQKFITEQSKNERRDK